MHARQSSWPSSRESSFTLLINYAPRAIVSLQLAACFFWLLLSIVLLLRYHDWIISCFFPLPFSSLYFFSTLTTWWSASSLLRALHHHTYFSCFETISSRFFACFFLSSFLFSFVSGGEKREENENLILEASKRRRIKVEISQSQQQQASNMLRRLKWRLSQKLIIIEWHCKFFSTIITLPRLI